VTVHYLNLTERGLEFFGKPDLNFRDWGTNCAADAGFRVIEKSVRPCARRREQKGDYD
jgi:hypothetical protein